MKSGRFLARRLPFAAPPLLFLAAFYFYPLLSLLDLAFRPEGFLDFSGLAPLFRPGPFLRILWFTTWQAALSTGITLAAALPGALVMARFRFRGQAFIQTVATVPFVLPTVVVAAAFEALLGPHGLLNQVLADQWGLIPRIRIDQTAGFIILAHVFYNYSVVLRLVGGFWAQIPPMLADAARVLGAGRAETFRRITLPLLAPAVIAAALLIFIFCFTSFGVVLILGGPRFATLEVAIYEQAVHYLNLPMAAALSLIQIGFTFVLMAVQAYLGRRWSVPFLPAGESAGRVEPVRRGQKLLCTSQSLVILVFLGGPLAALAASSFWGESGLTLDFYRALFTRGTEALFFISPGKAMLNSAGFALLAALLALALGLPAASFLARGGRLASVLDPVFMLPLSTSAVTLGFGFIIALDRPPLDLRSSIWLTPLAHALVAFPFVVRTLLPAWRGIPDRLREAASVLGAGPWAVWRRVELPLLGRAVLAAAVFAFAVSLGEFGATSFVARPKTGTLPLAIFRYLGQPGALNHGMAMAMSTLLMAVTLLAFGLMEKIRVLRMEARRP